MFDAIGLALFTMVGITKTLALGFPFWVAIVMGCITGAAGGVMRDVLINELPLVFRKEIYAMACVIGGLVYYICHGLHFDPIITQMAGGISVFLVRIIAVKYQIGLPILKGET